MKIKHYHAIPENTETCCTNTTIKELTPKEIGISNLNIKIFEMQPGGQSPLHQHSELHRLFITSGKGTLSDGQKTVHIHQNRLKELKTKNKQNFSV